MPNAVNGFGGKDFGNLPRGKAYEQDEALPDSCTLYRSCFTLTISKQMYTYW